MISCYRAHRWTGNFTTATSRGPADEGNRASCALERYLHYLLLPARTQLGRGRRAELDPSDVLEQTLLKAHENQERFRGNRESALAARLRAILVRHLADLFRYGTRLPAPQDVDLRTRREAAQAALDQEKG
jgi:DNA-directed RNA polymerase specialized sigma24 family protein